MGVPAGCGLEGALLMKRFGQGNMSWCCGPIPAADVSHAPGLLPPTRPTCPPPHHPPAHSALVYEVEMLGWEGIEEVRPAADGGGLPRGLSFFGRALQDGLHRLINAEQVPLLVLRFGSLGAP